ncbi:hypothetical protein [Mesonia aestuariivivens]|uniref:Alpha/beta hydrolase n=1 Tax=Mesonia aestuariivivens TaxID=2796128 RepID=A0ABS6W589_9FLAO|nr:hypothetical protein [Mesonia aestuariivivens]MBW2963038.1 hypothetical protein [Mesonia aestuariivivens]
MRLFTLLFLLLPLVIHSQNPVSESFQKDSLIIIKSNPSKGFNNSYILFIPKGTLKSKLTYLLVEPNNTGKISDSIEVHKKSAIELASISSVGNNISTYIKIPLLVPIFPRPNSKPLVYTHSLDRDVIFEKDEELERLDLQLIAMIRDAQIVLKENDILIYDKIFMNGFSASATFTNRFLFIHPDKVKAAAMGGLNGELMLPLKKYKNKKFNYPLGINDFKSIFNKEFNLNELKEIPQYIYMGKEDQNDAVQFDDAYNNIERNTINSTLGNNVQERWINCQNIYKKEYISAQFKTYDKVGHWTTSSVNLDVINFFIKQLKN